MSLGIKEQHSPDPSLVATRTFPRRPYRVSKEHVGVSNPCVDVSNTYMRVSTTCFDVSNTHMGVSITCGSVSNRRVGVPDTHMRASHTHFGVFEQAPRHSASENSTLPTPAS